MGVFNKINEKSGLIVSVIVIALALFIVGGDLLGPRSFFRGKNNNVGEIAGEDVTYEEYSKILDQAKQNMGGINDNNVAMVHSQVWNYFIQKDAYPKQYEKLGLTVTEEELEELTAGKNLWEGFYNIPMFKDPATQQFSRKLYDDWRKNLEKNDGGPEFFENFKKEQIIPDRLRVKYMALLEKAVYVTKEEAQREYFSQNNKAEVKYLYVPYQSLPDSAFKVEKEDVERYIQNHKKEFDKPERSSIEVVTFPIKPAPSDSLKAVEEFADLKKRFSEESDDSLFVSSNSDGSGFPAVMHLGELPESLKAGADSLQKGKVYGPFADGGRYKIYKIEDIITDPKDSNYYASTKHILFMTRDKPQGKDSIRKQAEDVLGQLKRGADFDEMVKKYSDDPGSKNRGGEYKWFPKGQMVKPFEQAVFNAKAPGLVPTLVETEYGFHILKVTNTKSNKKFQVAFVEKDIVPVAGREKAYANAVNFSNNAKDTVAFNALAKKDSLNVQKVPNLTSESVYVGSLVNPREIIRWALTQGEDGEISKVYQVGDQFVVACLLAHRKKGLAEPEEVMEEVKYKILAEKKSEKIIEKLKSLDGTIEKKAQAYGTAATTGTAQDVTMAAGSMQGVGYDPVIVGTVFGLVEGKRTVPLKGENGVAILEVVKFTKAQPTADYSSFKTSLASGRTSYLQNDVDGAIRKDADIEDNRIKFF